MNNDHARELLASKRAEVQSLLDDSENTVREDREGGPDVGDDAGQPLAAEGVDDAVAESLRDRLAALDRADARLADGTYGRSVLSGDPIPDERLEADPAAELTVEEANQVSS